MTDLILEARKIHIEREIIMNNEKIIQELEFLRLQSDRHQAYIDCCNVIARYVYYHASNDRDLIRTCFAVNTLGVNVEMMYGVFEGKEGLEAFFMHHPQAGEPDDEPGRLHIHTLTTPIVEVAGDCQTVKGAWYSPGVESDAKKGQWAWMKYGADFIKENGEWKIWHLHAYSIFMTPYDKCWTEIEPYGMNMRGGGMPPPMENDAPDGSDKPGGPRGGGYMPKPTTTYYGFDAESNYPGDQPTPPLPYETFDSSTAY